MNKLKYLFLIVFAIMLVSFMGSMGLNNSCNAGEMKYGEDGQPVWVEETQDGNYVTDDGDLLMPQDDVDLGGDETLYDTDSSEYEPYWND